MRVHVYADGFNLYRGGLELAGREQGWKLAGFGSSRRASPRSFSWRGTPRSSA